MSPASRARRAPGAARVSLLIPTHAIPPLSYGVPDRFRRTVRVGTAVVVPLSGRLRVGIVVATAAGDPDAREDVREVAGRFSLTPDLVELCEWISVAAAVPLPVALRAALPPGLDTGRYLVSRPDADLLHASGELVTRSRLKRDLGPDGLRNAEMDGSVVLSPGVPELARVEWAIVRRAAAPDLSRAPRQRRLLEVLVERGGERPSSELLAEADAARSALRELVRRGAVTLEERPEPLPILTAEGTVDLADFARQAKPAVKRGGAFVWRVPTSEGTEAAAALARAAVEGGEQALVLAPEIELTERLVDLLHRALPAGTTVAPYHSRLGRKRVAVYEAARRGAVDVIVGTRSSALLPFARLGMTCVVDEPNEGHRAEPGFEGFPMHVRDIAFARARIEGSGAFCLSPFPSMRLFAEVGRRSVRELPARAQSRWPSIRIVDMRGSGAPLSATALDACLKFLERGGRVGVVANRLGFATAVTCNGCGTVRSCPDCGLSLTLNDRTGLLFCDRCGHRERMADPCRVCGSDRASPVGLGVAGVRAELSALLGRPVGLLTASESESVDESVVVGTARSILAKRWEAVFVPEVDSLLFGAGTTALERAFRLVYGAAEAASQLLVVQTRLPRHDALREAARGDYPAFAAAELPRLRALGYPPFSHLASVTIEGERQAVRSAVESALRPALEPAVELSGPVPVAPTGTAPSWRVLLRSPDRSALASAATRAARLFAQRRGPMARVVVDPEEV